MKTNIVTRANGFIGMHFVPMLATSAFQIQKTGFGFGDLSDGKTWARLPSADVVIHLAVKSSVLASWECPPDFVQSNCFGSSYALEFCRQHHAKLIIFSSNMYGDAGAKVIPESAPVIAKNPYALTKEFSEKLCENYSNNFVLKAVYLVHLTFKALSKAWGFLFQRLFAMPKHLSESM
jgi:nucleoside-diphosphate-sugar epimerase